MFRLANSLAGYWRRLTVIDHDADVDDIQAEARERGLMLLILSYIVISSLPNAVSTGFINSEKPV